MPDPLLFLRGLAIGLGIAAPIGPVGLMCIRRALGDGRWAAWAAGLGAALADGGFGAAVGLGLGAFSQLLTRYEAELTLFGGLFMLILGVRGWRTAAQPMMSDKAPPRGSWWRDVLTTFSITLSNPGTILGVVGVFAALGGAVQPQNSTDSVVLVAGIFLGSVLWWTVLTELTILVRARFTAQSMRRFNHVSGAIIGAFGVAALGRWLLLVW